MPGTMLGTVTPVTQEASSPPFLPLERGTEVKEPLVGRKPLGAVREGQGSRLCPGPQLEGGGLGPERPEETVPTWG